MQSSQIVCNDAKKLHCGKLNLKKPAKYLSGAQYSTEPFMIEQ